MKLLTIIILAISLAGCATQRQKENQFWGGVSKEIGETYKNSDK